MCGCVKKSRVILPASDSETVTDQQKSKTRTIEELRRIREEYKKREKKVASEYLNRAVIIKKANQKTL